MNSEATMLTRKSRLFGIAAVGISVMLLLSGCGAQPFPAASATPVGTVQAATIQIQARGTFMVPGATESTDTLERGSGFIIDPSGIAVTNAHLVAGATTVDVWLNGDQPKKVSATVLGFSECTDLAVIQLEKGTYPALSWATEDIDTGLPITAAGYSRDGSKFTESQGSVLYPNDPDRNGYDYPDQVIQHNVRIEAGASGGPLLDANGNVVGVTGTNSHAKWQEGVDFATHRDQVLSIVDDLTTGTLVDTLGLNVTQTTPSDDPQQGLWVMAMADNSPAHSAGIKLGDVLTRINLDYPLLLSDFGLTDYCQAIHDLKLDEWGFQFYRPTEGAVYEGNFVDNSPVVIARDDLRHGQTVAHGIIATDSSKVLSVTVPESWTHVDGSGYTDAHGNKFYSLVSGANIDRLDKQGWGGAYGLKLSASKDAVNTDLAAVITGYKDKYATAGCASADEKPFKDDSYQGKIIVFADCGGLSSNVTVVAAKDLAKTHFILLWVQSSDAGGPDGMNFLSVDLPNILHSFQAKF